MQTKDVITVETSVGNYEFILCRHADGRLTSWISGRGCRYSGEEQPLTAQEYLALRGAVTEMVETGLDTLPECIYTLFDDLTGAYSVTIERWEKCFRVLTQTEP